MGSVADLADRTNILCRLRRRAGELGERAVEERGAAARGPVVEPSGQEVDGRCRDADDDPRVFLVDGFARIPVRRPSAARAWSSRGIGRLAPFSRTGRLAARLEPAAACPCKRSVHSPTVPRSGKSWVRSRSSTRTARKSLCLT